MRIRFLRAGLPLPEVNADIYDSAGKWIAMVDLSWPGHRVAFDYEGDHHRTDRKQWSKDLIRARRIGEAGITYVRAGAADLSNTSHLIAGLKRHLAAGSTGITA
ncbi:hypothetical protein BH09ACT1_BH09ACT1_15250 [soil metagenome]